MTDCGATTRSGGKCKRPAGWGTEHVGTGKCKLHGGNAGRPPIHGRYSLKHRQSLAHKREQFLSDPAPGNLAEELTMMRALLQDYLDRFSEGIPLPYEDVERIFKMLDDIGRMVERIAKIFNQTALTQAEVAVLQAIFLDVLNEFIPDSTARLSAVDTFQKRLGVWAGTQPENAGIIAGEE